MRIRKFITCVLVGIFSTLMISSSANAETEVKIDQTVFPNEYFRRYVSDNFDTNHDGKLSTEEINLVKEIDVASKGPGTIYPVDDLTGLEVFDKLEILSCGEEGWPGTGFDVSKNTSLKELYIVGYVVPDLSNNKSLKRIECTWNEYWSDNPKDYVEWDLSNNNELVYVNCYHNRMISKINLKDCTKLEYLNCADCNIEALDITNNTKLSELNCRYNHLTELNITKNTELTKLDCYGNDLTELYIGNNTKLTRLDCGGNPISSINLKGCAELKNLNCYHCSIAVLDISNNKFLCDVVYKGGVFDDNDDTKRIYFNDDTSLAIDINTNIVLDSQLSAYNDEWVNGVYYNLKGEESDATNGQWKKDKTGWWYSFRNNTLSKNLYLKNTWQKIDGVWYYFNKKGYMAAGEYWDGYWLNKNGSWTYEYRASWRKNKVGWWYGDSSGWYAKNRWLKIDGNWYYFDSKGYMVTGTVKISGKQYVFNKSGVWII